MFAGEPYDDWSRPLRDEARMCYADVLHALIKLRLERGEFDLAMPHLQQALALDPYAEQAHRAIIKVFEQRGRHGEAQRARERFERAMAELG